MSWCCIIASDECPQWVESSRSWVTVFDPKRTLIQSSVVSAGLIAGKPAPTGISPAFRHALYLWEPRLPAMGREAAPITDVRFESIAGWAGLKIGRLHIALSERCREQMGASSGLYQLDFSPFAPFATKCFVQGHPVGLFCQFQVDQRLLRRIQRALGVEYVHKAFRAFLV